MKSRMPRIRPQLAVLLMAATTSARACTRLVFHSVDGQVMTAHSMD